MSKVVCECGTELLKSSLKAHLLTDKHKRLLAAMPKRAPAQQEIPKLTKAQAMETLTSAIRSRKARQEVKIQSEEIKKQTEIVKENSKNIFKLKSNPETYKIIDINPNQFNKIFQYYKIEGNERFTMSIYIEEYLLSFEMDIPNELIYSMLEKNNKNIKNFDEFMMGINPEYDNLLNIINYFIKYSENTTTYPADITYDITGKAKEFYDYGIENEGLETDMKRMIKYFGLKMDYNDDSFNNFKMIFKASYDKFKNRYYNTKMRISLIESIIEYIQNS